MAFFGYHRTSTKEQHLDRGIKQITEYCVNNHIKLEKIYVDQSTGKNFDRPRYIVLKEDVLRKGDTLIVTEIDRLGRNKKAILEELKYFKENGVIVWILELPITTVDYYSRAGGDDKLAQLMLETMNEMLIQVYANLAEAEMHKKKKRMQEGIEAMKLRGEWDKYGRPRKFRKEELAKIVEPNLLDPKDPNYRSYSQSAKMHGISRMTFSRYKKEYLEMKQGEEKSD